MLTENAMNVYRFLCPHWPVIPAVLGSLVVVEAATDLVRLDRPAFSPRAVGLLVTARIEPKDGVLM